MAVSRRLRFEVLRRDNHTCRYCGATAPDVKLTVDHVNPTALGGEDRPENLVTACEACNGGKSSMPADASIVADVAADALRWSRAIQAAANQMLADLEHRDQLRAEFDTVWRSWGSGKGPHRTEVPRPDDWAKSVDRFIAVGLPMPVLLDCLDSAMRAGKVKPNAKFRYMCGIAWKKVGDLQDAARVSLGAGVLDHEPGEDILRAYDFALELLEDHFTEDERNQAYGTYFGDDGAPSDVDMTPEESTLAWAYDTVSTSATSLRFLTQQCLKLLEVLPFKKEIEVSDNATLDEERLYFDPESVTESREGRIASILGGLIDLIPFAGLPDDAQVSYFEWTNPKDSTALRLLTAARLANGKDRTSRNCLHPAETEGHAPCFALQDVRVWLVSCWRHSDGEDCDGHGMCRVHADEYLNGLHTNPSTGGPTAVVRVEQVEPKNPPF